jgi:hypothetical protein
MALCASIGIGFSDAGGGLGEELVLLDQPHGDTAAGKKAAAVLDDRFEDGLRIGHRSADYAQDLRGGRLPLEGLLGLVEQAHVLDGDHGLVGKGGKQPHFLVGQFPDVRR